MAISILQPTAFQTPDPALGGLAVTTPSNTGHATTQSLVSVSCGPEPDSQSAQQVRNCVWTSFASVGGIVSSINLRADWQVTTYSVSENSPQDSIADADISHLIEYSVNNGASYTTANSLGAATPPNQTSSGAGSINISIPNSTPLAQIRVRDRLIAGASCFGGIDLGASANASVSANISNIRLEVETYDRAGVLVLM